MTKTKALIACALFALVGCTDAQCAAAKARGDDHRIRLWSGGQAVGEWRSKGHTTQNEGSSVVFFMDKETGLFVKLRGTISVEQIKE